MYPGPTTEPLHRPAPQKSVRRLRESINITWGTVLGGSVRVHELADRTIDLFGVQGAKIHPYPVGESSHVFAVKEREWSGRSVARSDYL
jgi:hypothetical protein